MMKREESMADARNTLVPVEPRSSQGHLLLQVHHQLGTVFRPSPEPRGEALFGVVEVN